MGLLIPIFFADKVLCPSMGRHKGALKMLSVVWELCGYSRSTSVLKLGRSTSAVKLTSQPAGRVTATLIAA